MEYTNVRVFCDCITSIYKYFWLPHILVGLISPMINRVISLKPVYLISSRGSIIELN